MTTKFRHGMRFATSAAIDLLLERAVGDVITRPEMARHIGESCDWGTPGHRSVCTAIKHVEGRKTWRWDRNEIGWRCLSPMESAIVCASLNKQAQRRAKRSLKVAVGVDEKQLTPDELKTHNLNVCVSSLLVASGSRHLRKRLSGQETKKLIGPNYDQLATLINSITDEKGE